MVEKDSETASDIGPQLSASQLIPDTNASKTGCPTVFHTLPMIAAAPEKASCKNVELSASAEIAPPRFLNASINGDKNSFALSEKLSTFSEIVSTAGIALSVTNDASLLIAGSAATCSFCPIFIWNPSQADCIDLIAPPIPDSMLSAIAFASDSVDAPTSLICLFSSLYASDPWFRIASRPFCAS